MKITNKEKTQINLTDNLYKDKTNVRLLFIWFIILLDVYKLNYLSNYLLKYIKIYKNIKKYIIY